MSTVSRTVQCKQCGYPDAASDIDCRTYEEFTMCCRCGYGETWYWKCDDDGEYCGWKHEISVGAGVVWYQKTGGVAFCSQPLTIKDVLAEEIWLREQIANGSIDEETAYLTRWNRETKEVERVVGDFEWPKQLMGTLGFDCLAAEAGKTVRFAILPVKVAIVTDPYCAIVSVVHYLNADPVSGRYDKKADGSVSPVEWEIRYLGLSRANVKEIENLRLEDPTPFDMDALMSGSSSAFGRHFRRISPKARWKLNPERAAEVEKAAIEASNVFEAKLLGKPGVTIVDDFRGLVPRRRETEPSASVLDD